MFNDLWGLVDKDGKVIFEPQFDDIYRGTNGDNCIGIYVKNKIGYVSFSGETIYEPQFNDIWDYDSNVISVVEYKSRKTPLKKKAPKAEKTN